MSNADRRHVFFESQWPEQKNTHVVDVIHVVQGDRQMNFFLFCFASPYVKGGFVAPCGN